ncbi:Uncharacterised protein [Vibrio cholerae]|nr:Uncharacterised protein [Vibrio cholerae]
MLIFELIAHLDFGDGEHLAGNFFAVAVDAFPAIIFQR